MSNLNRVKEDDLCTGCATCISLCPKDAIILREDNNNGIYIPEIQVALCNNCGICYKVCPGHSVNFKELNIEIFRKKPENIYLGNYLNCYTGHSSDHNIRFNSASGGLVTQLLISALEEEIINGALVTRMKKDDPLKPEPFIAKTANEILEASKSKYCPVPVNIMLKEILKSNEREKFAVVGLPCHIHGIRKAESMNKLLKEKIILHIGLFCHHTPSFLATDFLLKKLKVDKAEVRGLDYRGEGWPGKTKIRLKNGEIVLPYRSWKFLGSYFFTPVRCFLCSDATNELADISFADAWFPEFHDEKIGKSLVISRSEFGDRFLKAIELRSNIELEKISADRIVSNYNLMLNFKKVNIGARINLFNKAIEFDNILQPNFFDSIIAFFPFISVMLLKYPLIIKLMTRLPFRALWVFSLPYIIIYKLKNIDSEYL